MKVAILASGSGTTAEAFAQAIEAGKVEAEIGLVVHNNPGAKVVEQPTIKRMNIPTRCINGKTQEEPNGIRKGELSDAESQAIVDAVHWSGSEVVLLLGFMKRVRGALLDEFGFDPARHSVATDARMLNTHPGPLPETEGLYGTGVHERVFELSKLGKLSVTGPTLHVVAADYDTGPVVQFFDQVQIGPDDTAITIEERVREVEREQMPLGVHDFIQSISQ